MTVNINIPHFIHNDCRLLAVFFQLIKQLVQQGRLNASEKAGKKDKCVWSESSFIFPFSLNVIVTNNTFQEIYAQSILLSICSLYLSCGTVVC